MSSAASESPSAGLPAAAGAAETAPRPSIGAGARLLPRTLAILPAKDEAATIVGVLRDLHNSVPGVDAVVVDDGSSDATGELARAAGAVVLTLPFNLGIGGALRTGFRYAVEHGYARAVQLDADGQHDPAQIPVLLDALDDGADLVIGTRFAHERHTYRVGRVRARAMGILRFIVRQFSGQRFSDTSSGFRAFGPDVLDLFAREYPAEYMESVEALLLACAEGFTVTEVPVHMHARAGGEATARRLRLLYHYVRLLLVIAVTAPGQRRRRARRTPGPSSPAGGAP